MFDDIDGVPASALKCKNCGKLLGLHKAVTYNCPTGMKTRIGYSSYALTTFEVKAPTRKEIEKYQTQFKIKL